MIEFLKSKVPSVGGGAQSLMILDCCGSWSSSILPSAEEKQGRNVEAGTEGRSHGGHSECLLLWLAQLVFLYIRDHHPRVALPTLYWTLPHQPLLVKEMSYRLIRREVV